MKINRLRTSAVGAVAMLAISGAGVGVASATDAAPTGIEATAAESEATGVETVATETEGTGVEADGPGGWADPPGDVNNEQQGEH